MIEKEIKTSTIAGNIFEELTKREMRMMQGQGEVVTDERKMTLAMGGILISSKFCKR